MKLICTLVFLICIPAFLYGQREWYISFSPGLSYIPKVPLVINQQGFPQISFCADYESAPMKTPLYYSYRLGYRIQKKGWEAEMNHLKIYLRNKPSEIQRFSISHGYNQFFINRAWYFPAYLIKVGAGFVLAHPENTVHNISLNEKEGIFNWGYYLAGPVVQGGICKEIFFSRIIYFLVEGKISFAYAIVPVAGGRAHVPLMGLHLQIGPGLYFDKKGAKNDAL